MTADAAPRSRGRCAAAAAMVVLAAIAAVAWWRLSSPSIRPIPAIDTTGMSESVVRRLAEYRARLESTPVSARAWGEYGMVLFQHERLREALACLDQSAMLDPESPRWPYYAAIISEQIDFARARDWYERAYANDSRYAPLVLRLANVLSQSGESERARSLLQSLREQAPGIPATYVELSRLARKQGDAAGALAILNAARDRGLDTRELANERALAATLAGNRDQAAEALEHGRQLPPGMSAPPDPWMGDVHALDASGTVASARADALRQQGQIDDAEAALADLARSYPDRSRAAVNHASLLLQQGKVNEAIVELEELRARFPDDPLIPITLAQARMAHEDPGGAEQALRAAIALKPDLAHAHLALGRLLESSRPDEAAHAYRQAIEAAPGNPEPYLALAHLLIPQNRQQEARKLLEQVRALKLESNDLKDSVRALESTLSVPPS